MKNIVKVWRSSTAFLLSAFSFLILVSCSQEEILPQETSALRFVVGDFPMFGEGIQTRAIGTQDEGKTAWKNGDQIIVTLTSQKYGEQAAALTYDGSSWSTEASLSYLENETPTVSAVYAPCYEVTEEGVKQLRSGMQLGMCEYLKADCEIQNGTINISFDGALRTYSRLRIAAMPEATLTVSTEGFTPAGATSEATGAYTLTADEKGNAYLYGTFAEDATVSVKQGDTEFATHTFNAATEAGKSYALYAGKKVDVDLSTLAATYVINDDAYYTFSGTGSYGIKVESGNPTIILSNASITVGEEYDYGNIVNALDIVADNSETTVWITGTNNLTSNNGAGIYVKSGSTVIIKSDSRDNVLTAQAGMDGAGIGGTGYDFGGNTSCGNIYIENVTVNAYGCTEMDNSPGIGDVNSCGTITIKNATVTARGSEQDTEKCSAIGSRTVPDIIIENSTINACRGGYNKESYADWIGAIRGVDDSTTPGIQCGNGYIKNTTVNKFMYDWYNKQTTEEGSVTYDADGNPTENKMIFRAGQGKR